MGQPPFQIEKERDKTPGGATESAYQVRTLSPNPNPKPNPEPNPEPNPKPNPEPKLTPSSQSIPSTTLFMSPTLTMSGQVV